MKISSLGLGAATAFAVAIDTLLKLFSEVLDSLATVEGLTIGEGLDMEGVASVKDLDTVEDVATVKGLDIVGDAATVDGVATVKGLDIEGDVARVEGVATVKGLDIVDGSKAGDVVRTNLLFTL